jgi:polar amino acid transport system substrate-binding protein
MSIGYSFLTYLTTIKRLIIMERYLVVIIPLFSSILLSASAVSCTLILAYEEWPPFVMIDANGGEPSGLDIEAAKLLAKGAGCTLSMKEVSWKRSLEELKQGKVDIVTGASHSAERAEYANFSAAYREETLALFVAKDNIDEYNLNSLADILNTPRLTLGVQRGAVYGDNYDALAKRPDFAERLRESANDIHNMKKLYVGRVGALLGSLESTYMSLKNIGADQKITDIKSTHYSNGGIFILFSKKSVPEDTIGRFNQALVAAKADGSYDTLMNSYRN